MTISFNGGVDPEEIKFNGQDMEAVVLYNDQFPNGVTVWEKVVGDQYTVTSGEFQNTLGQYRGWTSITVGSISPTPTFPSNHFVAFLDNLTDSTFRVDFNSNSNPLPVAVKFEGSTYPLNPFLSLGSLFISVNPSASLLPLYVSIEQFGNNTTFELIYP